MYKLYAIEWVWRFSWLILFLDGKTGFGGLTWPELGTGAVACIVGHATDVSNIAAKIEIFNAVVGKPTGRSAAIVQHVAEILRLHTQAQTYVHTPERGAYLFSPSTSDREAELVWPALSHTHTAAVNSTLFFSSPTLSTRNCAQGKSHHSESFFFHRPFLLRKGRGSSINIALYRAVNFPYNTPNIIRFHIGLWLFYKGATTFPRGKRYSQTSPSPPPFVACNTRNFVSISVARSTGNRWKAVNQRAEFRTLFLSLITALFVPRSPACLHIDLFMPGQWS